MEYIYQILDSQGVSLGNIVATPEFVEQKYPGRYKMLEPNSIYPPVIISSALKARFTDEEALAVEALKTQTDLPIEVRSLLQVLDVATASYNLTGSFPENAKLYLIAQGILTEERGNMVFNEIVAADESPVK
jgi:hypothetical protein